MGENMEWKIVIMIVLLIYFISLSIQHLWIEAELYKEVNELKKMLEEAKRR